MNLKTDKSLNKIADELSFYISIDEFLSSKGIPCIALDRTDLCDGDELAFKFGHDYWGETVIMFFDEDYFNYYAVGNAKEIKELLRKELKDILETEKEE